MKSKILSLVLALTVLCSILSVSTVSFAAASKGDEVALPKTSFTAGTTGYIAAKVDTTLPGKDDPGSCIWGVPEWSIAKSYYKITPAIDLTQPFTFEYEYYAIDQVKTYFSFGSKDVFLTTETGSTYLNGAVCPGAIASFNDWNKVLFNYDGANYGVYLNGNLLNSGRFSLDESAAELNVGVYSQKLPAGSGYPEYMYIDEVYVYEGAYKPDGTEELVVEKDVISIGVDVPSVTASVTLSDTYATGEYRFYLATYDSYNGKELIGIASVDITEAGFYDLKVTFKDSDAFSAVDYAKAFVWDKNTLKPTAVKALLGSEPQN